MVSRKPHIVGKPLPRVEDQLKLTGGSRFVDDLHFDRDVLDASIVYSTRPHARLLSIDVSQAEALSGVVAVITGADVPRRQGVYLLDRPVLAQDVVRYVGEPVVAIAAESSEIAAQAAELVRIEYEDVSPVLEIEQGLVEGAALLHPDLGAYERADFVAPQPGSNIAHSAHVQRGDLAQGWAEAAVIVEWEYRVPQVVSLPLEPQGAVAQVQENGRVHLWSSNRAPFVQRQVIAQALDLEPEHLRVRAPLVGGGYGDKALVNIEAIVVALAQAVDGQPVKLMLRRGEAAPNTYAQPGLKAQLKMGADDQGLITALEATYLWDGGASADAMIEAAWAAAYVGAGPYDIPNVAIDSRCVYTNHPPAVPAREYGMAQLHWAVEQHIDRVAAALGQDAVELRLRNCVKGGDELLGGWVMHATGLDQCIRLAADAIKWSRPASKPARKKRRRGKGIAAMWKPAIASAHTRSAAAVILDEEGYVDVEIGAVDGGQGFSTVAVQLVAAALSVPVDLVRFSAVDTDSSPFQWTAPSGHLTWSLGNALLRAAQNARTAALAALSTVWEEPVGNLDINDGNLISYASERVLSLQTFLSEGVESENGSRVRGPFRGEGAFEAAPLPVRNGEGADLPVVHFSTGAVGIEIEVDEETGQIVVLHLAPAMDVGHAINPDIVASQIKGSALYGLSMSMFEQMRAKDGPEYRANLADYDMATMLDVPARLEPIIVEVPQDDGPFGARDMGEQAFIPTAAALAIALYDALGVRPSTLPLTSENVWRDLNHDRAEEDAT